MNILDELLAHIMDAIDYIKERHDALKRTTYRILTRVEKYIDVNNGIKKNLL